MIWLTGFNSIDGAIICLAILSAFYIAIGSFAGLITFTGELRFGTTFMWLEC